MMSKKTLVVLALVSIVLGCGKHSSQENVVPRPDAEQEKQALHATLTERRAERLNAEQRLAKLKQELAAEREKLSAAEKALQQDADNKRTTTSAAAERAAERVKILETELVQLETEAAAQRAESYRLVREQKLKIVEQQKKVGGK